jgi:peptidoglycan/xylan/chitin deacetylase (PgdA/CDA1 family)
MRAPGVRPLPLAGLLAALSGAALAEAAAGPYPAPARAAELACNLSPVRNPDHYREWWEAVPRSRSYRKWLWRDIVPRPGDDCAQDVRETFWRHAVPDEWAKVGNAGGWPAARGGYYAQTFWLRAVPDGWAAVGDIGGWPSPRGGYYAQSLWLRAVPDNWARDPSGTLGGGVYRQHNQGYYRRTFWERAVPDEWASRPDIGGWPRPSGGYYAQWFWLHAVPDAWARRPELAVGGDADQGFYEFWLYHFALPRDFAWRRTLSVAGSAGAGYYTYWQRTYFAEHHDYYRRLAREGGGYLAGAAAQGPAPVDRWFAPDARAVVVLSFDAEGTVAETCAVTDVLRRKAVPATFYVVGITAAEVRADPVWGACLRGFDVGNHTETHPGGASLGPRGVFAALPAAEQTGEIAGAAAALAATFGPGAGGTFRTPWCDAVKAFDESVVQSLLAAGGIAADSSIATVSAEPRLAGVAPALGLRLLSLEDFPYPFVLAAAGGRRLVALPFAYPSDRTARAHHRLNTTRIPPDRSDLGYAANVWKTIFDGVYARRGVMVLLLHPQFQSADGSEPVVLADLIAYMQGMAGVRFSTVREVAARFGEYLDRRGSGKAAG